MVWSPTLNKEGNLHRPQTRQLPSFNCSPELRHLSHFPRMGKHNNGRDHLGHLKYTKRPKNSYRSSLNTTIYTYLCLKFLTLKDSHEVQASDLFAKSKHFQCFCFNNVPLATSTKIIPIHLRLFESTLDLNSKSNWNTNTRCWPIPERV